MIGVLYSDKYAVNETFQLLKTQWEWYDQSKTYDVVIAHKKDLPEYSGNLINLDQTDFFKLISNHLNTQQQWIHFPIVEFFINDLRDLLKQYITLIEIPPLPWGYSYIIAVTHDVDVISVKDARFTTICNAGLQCISQGKFKEGIQFILSYLKLSKKDPWDLFDKWIKLENELGIKSTFFIVPVQNTCGKQAPQSRLVTYSYSNINFEKLIKNGNEIGIHGIDNWYNIEKAQSELHAFKSSCGNRTHWLMQNENSYKILDNVGYLYDSTCGYDDFIGFSTGTLQVYKPRDVKTLLELPMHIQDIALFGKTCWHRLLNGTWEKRKCLNLDTNTAYSRCCRILDFAMEFGGVITISWHYENITCPRNWKLIYKSIIERAKSDNALITTAKNSIEWFKERRNTYITYEKCDNILKIKITKSTPNLRIRLHIEPLKIDTIDSEYICDKNYVDIKPSKQFITVKLK